MKMPSTATRRQPWKGLNLLLQVNAASSTFNREAMQHLRDLVHNLPLDLNFETEDEATFCHEVLSCATEIAEPSGITRFVATEALSRKLLEAAFCDGGRLLKGEDFGLAAEGDIAAAMFITKLIFLKNYPRYSKARMESGSSGRGSNEVTPHER